MSDQSSDRATGSVPRSVPAWATVGVRTVDYHTAGEPFRIVPEPPVAIPGATVAERRANAIGDPDVDGLRQVLCFEPRGHADMYGGFVTPPDDDGAAFGVLFWHKDGFSTACGHGTIALGAWAVESGRVTADPSGTTDVSSPSAAPPMAAAVHLHPGSTGPNNARKLLRSATARSRRRKGAIAPTPRTRREQPHHNPVTPRPSRDASTCTFRGRNANFPASVASDLLSIGCLYLSFAFAPLTATVDVLRFVEHHRTGHPRLTSQRPLRRRNGIAWTSSPERRPSWPSSSASAA
jgi:hypothetical protein